MSLTAKKVLDRAEELGILEPKVIEELRRQVAESKYVVTAEAIVKVLVDKKHLTQYQARKLVSEVTTEPPVPSSGSVKPVEKNEQAANESFDDLLRIDSNPAPVSSPPDEDDEEIVDLEEALPPPQPLKAEVKPLPPKKATPKAPTVSVQGADDDVVTLEPARETPAKKPSPQPKPATTPQRPSPSPVVLPGLSPLTPSVAPVSTRPNAAASQPGMPSLGPTSVPGLSSMGSGLSPMGPGLSPVSAGLSPLGGSSLGGDPLLDPSLGGLAPAKPASGDAAAKLKKKKARGWDSPILLIGGGALGLICIAFVILYFALTRGTAQQYLEEANGKYRDGQYPTAIELYGKFASKYPEDPNVSFARVMQGMAQIRMAYDGASDMSSALKAAQEVLPRIEQEERFDEARPELESILPEIADSFATNARQATQMKEMQEQVGLAQEALKLVNNAAYIPSSRRKDKQTRIDGILEKIRVAERTINQGKALSDAMKQVDEKLADSDISGAYQVRATLLQNYPTLEGNADVVKSTYSISARERDLVKASPENMAAAADDPHLPKHRHVALVRRSGEMIQAPADSTALLILRGNLYAVDVASGKIPWRRFLGAQSVVQPIAASGGVFVLDQAHQEFLRLDLTDGRLVWRQALQGAAMAPQILGDYVFVTLESGRIVRLNSITGEIDRSAQLPQATANASGVDNRGKLLIQPGQHSTLFVLAAEDASGEPLTCQSAYYLGHKPGSIAVPPAIVSGYALVFENDAIDSCLVHALTINKEAQLERTRDPIRLRGRIITPPSIARGRLVVVTDLGDTLVLDVDSSNAASPVNITAQSVGGLKKPVSPYYALAGSKLLVADTRMAEYEIVATRQTLDRGESTFDGDAFVAPLQLFGDTLIHARRRQGASAITITGVNLADNKSWQVAVAAPLVSVKAIPEERQFSAVTAEGDGFQIPAESFKEGLLDQPSARIGGSFAQQFLSPAVLPEAKAVLMEQAGRRWAYHETRPGGTLQKVEPALPEGSFISATPVAFGGGLLAPLSGGSVWLFDPAAGSSVAAPLQPEIAPGAKVRWLQPVVIDERQFVAVDAGRGLVFLARREEKPMPFLAETKSTELNFDAIDAVAIDKTLFLLARGDTSDEIISYALPSLQETKRLSLQGRAGRRGLDMVGSHLFYESNTGELIKITSTLEVASRTKLPNQNLVAAPIELGGDLIVVAQNGNVTRIPSNGEASIVAQAGQFLSGAVEIIGSNLVAGGEDGTLHVLSLGSK